MHAGMDAPRRPRTVGGAGASDRRCADVGQGAARRSRSAAGRAGASKPSRAVPSVRRRRPPATQPPKHPPSQSLFASRQSRIANPGEHPRPACAASCRRLPLRAGHPARRLYVAACRAPGTAAQQRTATRRMRRNTRAVPSRLSRGGSLRTGTLSFGPSRCAGRTGACRVLPANGRLSLARRSAALSPLPAAHPHPFATDHSRPPACRLDSRLAFRPSSPPPPTA